MKHPNARWPYLLGTAALAAVTCAGFATGVALIAGVSAWIAGPVAGIVGGAFVGHAIYRWGPGDAELERSKPAPARDGAEER
jgi:hypothetical protein